MADHLAELKEACRSQEAGEPEERIKAGESRWFMGRPSAASPGGLRWLSRAAST